MIVEPFAYKIESLSDILEIIQRPKDFLGSIIDGGATDPLGRSDTGYPRPFPYGIWFRGQENTTFDLEPAAFRNKNFDGHEYYDERNMFHDLRLRTTDFNSAEFSNFDIMCMMRHHALPTRVLDWSESILVAAFFAINEVFKKRFNSADPNTRYVDDPNNPLPAPAIYAINIYRLNSEASLLRDIADQFQPGMMIPDDIDVVFRATCADHTYYEDVFAEIVKPGRDRHTDKLTELLLKRLQKVGQEFSAFPDSLRRRAQSPIGVMPKRANPRMDAQLSTFTIHGGKRNYFAQQERSGLQRRLSIGETYGEEYLNFIDEPVSLEELSNTSFKPFIQKFEISPFAIKRLMIELDRFGVTEPMLFPEMDNQAEFVKRRWSVLGNEREIVNLPRLDGAFGDRPTITDEPTAMHRLYGPSVTRHS